MRFRLAGCADNRAAEGWCAIAFRPLRRSAIAWYSPAAYVPSSLVEQMLAQGYRRLLYLSKRNELGLGGFSESYARSALSARIATTLAISSAAVNSLSKTSTASSRVALDTLSARSLRVMAMMAKS